jgi:hypothetical protein
MRRVNTRGIKQANKCMLMAAIACHLKKLLKWTQTKVETAVMTIGGTGKDLAFYSITLLHCRQLPNCTQPIFLLRPIAIG